MKREEKIARTSTIILFVALVRTILEPVRLHYTSVTPVTYEQIAPFLFSGGIITLGLLLMTVLSYFHKAKPAIVIAILVLLSMFIIKFTWLS